MALSERWAHGAGESRGRAEIMSWWRQGDARATAPEAGWTVVASDVDISSPAHVLKALGHAHHGSVIGVDSLLVPGATVAENVFLGNELQRFGFVQPALMDIESAKLLAQFELTVSPRQRVSDVDRAVWDVLAVVQAVARRRPIIVAADRIGQSSIPLIDALRTATRLGVAVWVVGARFAPYLRERAKVIVIGAGAGAEAFGELTSIPSGATAEQIVAVWLNHRLGDGDGDGPRELQRGRARQTVRDDSTPGVALAVRDWTIRSPRDGFSFVAHRFNLTVRRGEVIGIVGPDSSDLLLSLFAGSLGAPEGGSVSVYPRGDPHPIDASSASVEQANRAGFAYGSESPDTYDVHLLGGVPTSVSPSALRALRDRGLVDANRTYEARERGIVQPLVAPPNAELFTQAIDELTRRDLSVVALHEPLSSDPVTRRALLKVLCEQGTAVILSSASPYGVAEICDRVTIVAAGETTSTIARADHADRRSFLARILETRAGEPSIT